MGFQPAQRKRTMEFRAVKGTRDFYPDLMRLRNYICDAWRRVSLRNGFEEYDSPIFEYLDLFTIKSGQEIAEQLFSFTDRGGRDLAIRPEITPSLARMVNAKINSLPRPIKWFSIPRLCRAERPQKGRSREFFQWNIDIIGVDDVLADAEIIFTTIDYLRSVGLTPKDIKAKISSRKLLAAFLVNIGIAENELDKIYPVLDKKPRLTKAAFDEMLAKVVTDAETAATIKAFMSLDDIGDIADILKNSANLTERVLPSARELTYLFAYLDNMGIRDYCEFDPGIVRGLAYYTGIVFEVQDVAGELRAICGGGRYDNLLKDLGGPAVSGTGIAMGDCVLEILLREKGLLRDEELAARNLDYFVAYAGNKLTPLDPKNLTNNDMLLQEDIRKKLLEIVSKLREAGNSADFSYNFMNGNLKKQLKQASAVNAKICVIIGQEFIDSNELVVKDMATGEQKNVKADKFISQL